MKRRLAPVLLLVACTAGGFTTAADASAETHPSTGVDASAARSTGTGADHGALRIGLIAGEDPWSVALATGAQEAAAAIRRQGGVGGRSLILVPLPAARRWRDGAAPIAHLAAAPKTVALLGGSDGATAHLSAQVAARLRLPLLTASPETSLTRAGAVWVFRALADDRQQATALLDQVPGGPAGRRALLVVPGGREGRERQAALEGACRQADVRIAGVMVVDDTLPPPPTHHDLLLLWLDAEPARDLILKWGRELPAAVILGSTRLSHASFLDVLDGIDTLPATVFLAGGSRDWAHQLGQDMVNLLAAVMSSHGSDPAAVRAGLATMEPFAGGTGMMTFDGQGNLRHETSTLPLPQRDEDTHE